jgi:hypothetical protein
MKSRYLLIAFLLVIILASCKKLLEVQYPVNSIVTGGVFADSANANSAILGIYSQMRADESLDFTNSGVTIATGCSSDELTYFNGNPTFLNLYDNALTSQNGLINEFWQQAYTYIMQANACIQGLQASTTLTASTKNEFIGEATFLRAYCYFYLTNLFGDVPLVTSATNWAQTEKASRTPQSQIYQQLIADLKNCKLVLRADYSISGNERTRANQAAASALLSRIYLYTGDYKDAISESSGLISNSNFSLESSLANVFTPNNNEAILQFESNTSREPYNVTAEGYNILPLGTGQPPQFSCSPQLLKAFEPGDNRRSVWIDSTTYSGITYYYPYKYVLGNGDLVVGAAAPQYYTLLRLAEQYLIRAESEANLGDLGAAISDLNIIRSRAGLPVLSTGLTKTQVLTAVAQEWRIEFFAEWGHRWLDLRRTQKVDSVMSVVTPTKMGGGAWKTNQQLYPIPYSELQDDPNLKQNPAY